MRTGPLHKLCFWLAAAGLSLPAFAGTSPPATKMTGEAAQVYDWIVQSRDNQGLPFMILDKRQAHLWVFDRGAQQKGDAPVLLGSAKGDHTVPGIGDLKLSQIKPEDRTTPAGRFVADVGKNERGEDVVWVDYDSGVSMHPVLTTNAKEQRERRLATSTPADNRVSFGCINVPKAFHADVVLGTVRRGNSVVYILPDSSPLKSVFSQIAGSAVRPRVAAQ